MRAGIVLCMAGTVCNAAMMTTSGRVLSEKLDVLRLTFYTAPVSCLCLLPWYLWQEVRCSPCHAANSVKTYIMHACMHARGQAIASLEGSMCAG